ncbi:MAG: class I SAM-dependent methyltransferase [Dehalococcoidia bacterium]|jgi:ubiquinone/menaquinone biosynthesis C-methylase UbiE
MINSDKRDFDREAATWDEEPGRVRLANDIADAIAGEIELKADMDVLDFGCGTGLISVRLSPLVHSITAVDSSQSMLDVLQAKIRSRNLTNVETRRLDFEQGEVLGGNYHLVICSMTLHHIGEIGPLLGQFYKILNTGGYLCIADLDPDDGQFHGNNDGVLHFGFERSKLRFALTEAGFADIRDRTAAEVLKPVSGSGKHSFSVFLITGCKCPSRKH